MATPTILDVKQIPGTLIKNPTNPDLDTESCGGTILGDSDDIYLVITQRYVSYKSAIYGRTYDKTLTEEEVSLVCLQRDFDADMLATILPETSTSTSSGKPLITGALQTSGRRLLARKCRLLLRPREPEFHQGVLFYAAAGHLEEGARMPFEVQKDWGLPVVFDALVSDAGNTWKLGYLRDFGTSDLS